MLLKPPLAPMETRSVNEIPTGDRWQYEPKWAGFRCIAFRDGELVVPVKGALSFDELQLRLHPAARRVAKLAKAHPATYIVFDLLAESGQVYLQRTFRERRQLLEKFARSNLRSAKDLRLSPATTDRDTANEWFQRAGGDLDGIIAKRLDAAYAPGERTAAVKVKQIRTADCVVGGFRYATAKRVIGSLLLGLYDEDGLLHHVGFTSGIKSSERVALTARLEDYIKP